LRKVLGPMDSNDTLYSLNPLDHRTPEEQDFFRNLRWFQDPINREQSGSSFTTNEQRLAAARLGDIKLSDPDLIKSSIRVAIKALRDDIATGSSGRDTIAREILNKRGPGFADYVLGIPTTPEQQTLIQEATRAQGGGGGIATPPPAAAPPLAPGAAKPQLNHDGGPVSGELGDTRGMRDVPPIPTAPSGSKPGVVANMQSGPPVTVTLRSPTGQTGQKTMAPQDLARFLTQNPKWSLVGQ